jgi:hypothetical protein
MEKEIEALLTPAADLHTSVEIRGSRAIYEVRTCDPLYQERLLHMGFVRAGEARFTRNLSNAGDVRATHRNFAQDLEEMLLQSARIHTVRWEETLELFLRRVERTPLRWFLYGSGALAVRGIDIQPGDLDFWVSDAQLAGRIFEDLLVEPVTTMTGWVADCGGRAFAGCIFEWLAGLHPEVDEPTPHEHGLVALRSLESVSWHGWTVLVPPLGLQLSVAEQRGLSDRVARIRAFRPAKLSPSVSGGRVSTEEKVGRQVRETRS